MLSEARPNRYAEQKRLGKISEEQANTPQEEEGIEQAWEEINMEGIEEELAKVKTGETGAADDIDPEMIKVKVDLGNQEAVPETRLRCLCWTELPEEGQGFLLKALALYRHGGLEGVLSGIVACAGTGSFDRAVAAADCD
ncbi:hypothetical protein ILUMI_09422 [Ignelater luminosus]|uniref:Uncharacterized protein n=1 Tax=Ignelater luminosus TaxID=2038154 RepID=A0A8K0D981_IGNLU|nr:hypothetical protein ILUMI_09422 [Ignelater luminosus]